MSSFWGDVSLFQVVVYLVLVCFIFNKHYVVFQVLTNYTVIKIYFFTYPSIYPLIYLALHEINKRQLYK